MHCISVVSGSERYLSLWKTSSSWLINSISVIASTDGFFVSRYVGADALSAINIVYPLIGLAVGIGIMLGTGGSAVIARQLGIGEGRFVCNGGKTQSGAGADDSFRPGQHGTGLCLYRGFRLGDCGRGMDDCGWIFHSSCFRTFLFLETKNGDNEYFYFFAVYALSNGKVSAMISMIRTFGFTVAGILLFSWIWQMNGLWLAVPAAECVTLVLALFQVKKYKKVYEY